LRRIDRNKASPESFVPTMNTGLRPAVMKIDRCPSSRNRNSDRMPPTTTIVSPQSSRKTLRAVLTQGRNR
jgi:hypothetical protein